MLRVGAVTTAVAVAAAALVLGPGSAAADTAVLRIGFDAGETLAAGTRVVDTSGVGNHGTVRTRSGGALRLAQRTSTSRAAAFPATCTRTLCPKAVVEVPDSAALDPGLQPFSFGVSVRLQATQTSRGSNLVQKGLWGDPAGQWKLQVDGYHGRPSCVVSGAVDGTYRRVTVVSSRSVADASWHRVACRRTASAVEVLIDGVVTGRAAMRPVLLSSRAAVLVGGKNYNREDNDQYFGSLDDVFVRRG